MQQSIENRIVSNSNHPPRLQTRRGYVVTQMRETTHAMNNTPMTAPTASCTLSLDTSLSAAIDTTTYNKPITRGMTNNQLFTKDRMQVQMIKHTNSVMRIPTFNPLPISPTQHNTSRTTAMTNHHPSNPYERRGGDLIVQMARIHHPTKRITSVTNRMIEQHFPLSLSSAITKGTAIKHTKPTTRLIPNNQLFTKDRMQVQMNKRTNSTERTTVALSPISIQNTTNRVTAIANHHPSIPKERRGGDLMVQMVKIHHPTKRIMSITNRMIE